jgi:ABC-type antimicrobial peptide transport system permease subunit
MAERSTLATARTRIVLGLFAAFAATGLLLSAVGLYGTVSYAVVRRYREMGLRLALGAAKRDVLRLVLTPATRHIAIGAIAGVTGALALTRLLTGLLFEVQAGDPAVLASATALLIVVALGAAWIPASRATRVDAARTLRE